MTPFRNLPDYMRAYALVGYYMHSFAYMEFRLGNAIGKALGLNVLQMAVIAKNVQYRNKVHILRTLIDSSHLDDASRKKYDKLCIRLGNISTDRNTVAHDMFVHQEDGDGVSFFVTKATGKFAMPDEEWTADEIDEKCKELTRIADDLKRLETMFGSPKTLNSLTLASLFSTPPLTAPVASDRAPLLPPLAPDYPLPKTTDATVPETPQGPQGETE